MSELPRADGLILGALMPPLEEERIDEPRGDVDQLLGFDVNDFESNVIYAVFNDPDDPDIRDLPEALRPQLLDVPLYEDDSPTRVFNHARLMNEDRDRMTPPRGHVRVREQTILKTPWKDVEL